MNSCFFPPSVGYIRRDRLHEDRGLREGHGTTLKDFDLINHRPIFRDKEVNVFIRVVMSRNLEHFKLAKDTKDDHNKYPNK